MIRIEVYKFKLNNRMFVNCYTPIDKLHGSSHESSETCIYSEVFNVETNYLNAAMLYCFDYTNKVGYYLTTKPNI